MGANLEALFGDYTPSTEGSGLPISHSKELARVLALPLRDPMPIATKIAPVLSGHLRTPTGTMELRPLQALALAEAYDYRGLLALLPVGEGKTLLSFLLPLVLPVERPLLIVPASLIEKTEIEFQELRADWQYAPMQITSYELISRQPNLLNDLAPDCLICDEVHALKDPKSACTKRVWRYIRSRAKANKRLLFCGMSGTIAARSFKDWWHIQQWALMPQLQPLPYDHPTMLSWCEALDEKIGIPRPVGALAAFTSTQSTDPAAVRQAFGERLRLVPSIVSSKGGEVAASIAVHIKLYNVPAITAALVELRRTWCTPGGEEFSEAADLWRHAREMANGFYYKWREPGPLEWMEARRVFNAFVRGILHGSRTYDSMGQVKQAFAAHPEVANWVAIEHTFEPVTVPVWFDTTVLDMAATWATGTEGLIWVEHRAVGQELQAMYEIPYFGEGGRDRLGNSIINHRGAAVVSQKAVSRGFNLQRYADNLILNMTPIGTRAEQLFGRTHRQRQLADVVRFEFLITAAEQHEGFRQMQRDSLYEQQTSGQRQKLCLADVTTTGALAA